jgi:myosin-crossreactive antigen
LRIDLRIDDIGLWKFHHDKHPGNKNLLLACESNSGELSDTNLTWVVGAAIRSALVEGTSGARDLLKNLGVSEELVDLAAEHCPDLGGTAVWAFHLERHGWLTATPVES